MAILTDTDLATEIGGTFGNIQFCNHTLRCKVASGLAFIRTYSFDAGTPALIYFFPFI
jgi:hypothetical protein